MEERLRSILKSLLGAGFTLSLGLTGATADAAQARTGTVRVQVVAEAAPVPGATVSANGVSVATDTSGVATLTLPPGSFSIIATKDGYDPATARVEVVAEGEHAVRLVMTARPAGRGEGIVVTSTRTGRQVDEQAVPVDLLGRDRIEANLLTTPGNIVSSLDEMASLRMQVTSPELGLAMARMRGLRGQYTRLLSDGVPLYFDHPGGLAPAQIPPMDLDRIEVMTGGTSALFGANPLAGSVNLLSRRPGTEPTREFLFSQSTKGATDGVLWISPSQTGSWGSTTLVSGHWQKETDVDDDGWSDIPGYERGMARQRVFWNNGRGRSASGTAGVTFETREGGTAIAHQSLETKIADGALFGQMPLGRYILAGAGSLYVQSRTRDFADRREHERRQAATFEIELKGSTPHHTWVAGIGVDWFAIRTPEALASGYIAPRGGLFVHDDVRVARWLVVSGSARVDYDKQAGEAGRVEDFFFSPRGSVLMIGGPWAARISAGRSYFLPTVLTEETEAAGLARLTIDGPLDVEKAHSVSADLSYKTGAAAVTVSVFHSRINHPALINRLTYTLHTDADPVVSEGAEILALVRRAPFALSGTYALVRASERDGREVALTPRHTASVIAVAEGERGRVRLEVSFTGAQRLEANPYRSTSEPYTVSSLLGELRFGRWRVFVTAENLTDVRQTRWDPLTRPAPDVDGRWTVDAWAPLQGRAINGGIRVPF